MTARRLGDKGNNGYGNLLEHPTVGEHPMSARKWSFPPSYCILHHIPVVRPDVYSHYATGTWVLEHRMPLLSCVGRHIKNCLLLSAQNGPLSS